MKIKRKARMFFASLLAIVLTLQFLPFNQLLTARVHAQTVSLQNIDARDGIILQLHMWSYNNIKSKLPEIAAAGYKSIQVSPIQGAKSGTEWWSLYQPTNQSIGNILGSRSEFASLCAEAETYGIDIIVDAVLNHMANKSGTQQDAWSDEVDSAFKRSDFYHNLGQCTNWTNRWAVTQQGIGMPDLNTQHPEVQAKAIAFLNDAIACGADGFRFDAAKHIESNVGVDANQSFASNYWVNVLGNLTNRSNLFLYGEVLDEANSDSDNMLGYASFMSVTDHYYGNNLRNAAKSGNLTGAQNWAYSLPVNTRVAYVENHDNFEHNESGLSDNQRKIAWGILASRNNVTPMYLSRRTGSLGSIGTTDYANQEIAAVNWFHNAMIGESEYLRYANNNQTMLVDRGTKGTAIINAGNSFYLDSATNLASGTYTDKGGSSATFTVSNGRITGNVPSNRIVVLYAGTPSTGTSVVTINPTTPVAGQSVSIIYDATGRSLAGSSQVSIHWGYNNWISPQTVAMTNVGANKWNITFTLPQAATTSLDFVFTNGSSWDNNSNSDWHITTTTSGVINTIKAYFDNSSYQWSTVNVYMYDESGSTVKKVAAWPGVAMNHVGNGIYSYELPTGWNPSTTQVIFNNGSVQIPSQNQAGYYLNQSMILQNGTWSIYNQ